MKLLISKVSALVFVLFIFSSNTSATSITTDNGTSTNSCGWTHCKGAPGDSKEPQNI